MDGPATLRIVVPGPAIPKSDRIGRGAGGRPMLFVQKETRAYMDRVRDYAYLALRSVRGKPIDGAVVLAIQFFLEPPGSWSAKKRAAALGGLLYPTAKPDLDNVQKSTQDALKGILWHDDAQISDCTTMKRYSAKPRVVILVRPVETPSPLTPGEIS